MTSIEFAAREQIPLMLNNFSGVMAGLMPGDRTLIVEACQERCGCPRKGAGMTVERGDSITTETRS